MSLRSSLLRAAGVLFLVGAGALAGCWSKKEASTTASPAPSASGFQVPRLTPQEAMARIDAGEKMVIVDVRPKEPFERGHIEGAINMPWRNLQNSFSQLPKDRFILLYCT